MTGVWVTADTITAARMNEKTILQASGSTLSGITTYAGQLVFCTSSGSGFLIDTLYKRDATNSSWSIIGADQLPYLKLSTTIGDYTAPASATSSSAATASATTLYSETGTTRYSDFNASQTRYAEKFSTGHALIGAYLTEVKVDLKKTGSPTGTVYIRVRNSADTIVEEVGNVATSSVSTSYTEHTFTAAGTTLIADGYKICVEHTTSDGSNYLTWPTGAANSIANAQFSYYNGSWNDDSAYEANMRVKGSAVYGAANAVDTSTSTRATTNSEASPYVYVDLTSNREIVGVALNLDTSNTTVTAIKIRASTDTSFDDSENIAYINVSDFTNNTWRYIANNFLADNRRYVQIIGVGTGVLSIYEIKVRYGVSDAVKILSHRHRTRLVTAADSFTDSN